MCTCSNFQVFWSDISIYKSPLYLQELCTLIQAQMVINIWEISNSLCAQFFYHSLTNLICIRNPKNSREIPVLVSVLHLKLMQPFRGNSQDFSGISGKSAEQFFISCPRNSWEFPGILCQLTRRNSRDFLGNILENSWEFPEILGKSGNSFSSLFPGIPENFRECCAN